MEAPSSVEDDVIPELIKIWNNYRNSYTITVTLLSFKNLNKKKKKEKEIFLFLFTKKISEESLSTPNIHQIFQLNRYRFYFYFVFILISTSDIPSKEIISCLSEEFFLIVGRNLKEELDNERNYSLLKTLNLFMEVSFFFFFFNQI